MTVEFSLRHRPCPLCGSCDDSVIVAEAEVDADRLDRFAFASRKSPELMHHRLVACPTCDVVYANPAPTAESLERAYADADFDSSEEARCASATYAGLVRELLPTLPLTGGALDIGTGEGSFLGELVSLGFDDVVGFEPSLAPVGEAPPEIAGRIRRGVFRAGELPPASFRLVTIFQTLEHLDDPMGVCRDVRGLLADGGAVLVVAHDRRALVNRLMGSRSPIYDIEHLQLFSPRSLSGLLTRAGFDGVSTEPIVNRYPLRYWARLLPLPRVARQAGIRVLDRTGLARAIVGLRVGNLAAVGYRR